MLTAQPFRNHARRSPSRRYPKGRRAGRTRSTRLAVLLAVVALGAAGCVSSSGSENSERGYPPAVEALEEYAGNVLSKGPHGEASADVDSIQLTAEEIAQVKQMDATAAIVMHFTGDSWSAAQIAGLRDEFKRLGIRIISTTDAGADPARQVANIENVITRKPDVMASIPMDMVATASAYKKAARAGVKIVFMENAPQGMKAGQDYVSVVATDNYGQGVVTAHLMADALGGQGKVGAIFHAAEFPTNVDRFEGFADTIARDYPDIELVESEGLLGPNWEGQGEVTANAMMIKHQDLRGIWCWFDIPCEGAMAAARSLARNDLAVTAVDLGKNVAIEMARGGMVTGIGAARPYDQGVVEARLSAYALLDKQAPPFVALDAVPVTQDSVLDAWQSIYHEDAPGEVAQSFKKGG